jgi:hypothetical protein
LGALAGGRGVDGFTTDARYSSLLARTSRSAWEDSRLLILSPFPSILRGDESTQVTLVWLNGMVQKPLFRAGAAWNASESYNKGVTG